MPENCLRLSKSFPDPSMFFFKIILFKIKYNDPNDDLIAQTAISVHRRLMILLRVIVTPAPNKVTISSLP